jgi:hypothetical protein
MQNTWTLATEVERAMAAASSEATARPSGFIY